MMKRIAMVVLAVAVSLALAGCGGSASTPVGAVEEFTAAVDNQRIDDMLACCDSSTNAIADGIAGFADGILGAMGADFGMGSKDLATLLVASVCDINTMLDGREWSLSVQPKDLVEEIVDDTHATVTGLWEVTCVSAGNEITQEGPVSFDLVKEDGVWRVDLSGLLLSGLGY